MADESEIFENAIRCSQIFGEDLFNLLMLEDIAFHDWFFCCNQRIHEEYRRRIETGIATPVKHLKWQIPGNDAWNHNSPKEVDFK